MDELAAQDTAAAPAIEVSPAPAPVDIAEPVEGQFLGAGGGSPEAASAAFDHYADPVPQPEEPELAPEVPAERPDLPAEELDAKVTEVSDVLARPDSAEVGKVVTSLVGMSDTQRKEVMGQLSDDEFDALMDNLPPGETERLNELVAATDDPKRKLRVWGAAEQAELGREGRNLDNVPTSSEFADNESAVLARRITATKEGQDEVKDELEAATERLDDPSLTEEEQKKIVNDLIARKEKERDIERQFGVNLTNDKGGTGERGMPTPRAVWSEEELEQMEVVLERLPDEAVQENPDLQEIRRCQTGYNYDSETETWEEAGVVGRHSKGLIRVFDATMDDKQDHHGDSSPIAGFEKVTSFQQTLAHEIGHNVDAGVNDEGAAKLAAVAGWKSEEGPAAKNGLAACKKGGLAPDGRMYVKNENGSISSFDPTLIPVGGAHSEHGGTDKDTWDYAATKPSDYFAEMYSKGVVAPELLYEDLVTGPAAKVEELKKNNAPQAEIAEAERVQKSMAAQHATLRSEVFHLDDEQVEDKVALLEARADEMDLDAERKQALLDDYRAAAAQAMTPEQLEAVYLGYDDAAMVDY